MELRDALGTSLSASHTIERELGGGGMSRVFLAEERRLGRKVVIKTLAPELLGDLSASRFEREMMLAASLQHPHIVPVLGAGVAGDVPYYTMPFIEGSTLRARLERDTKLPIGEAVRTLTDLATAMAYAHSHGVVHRDLKPENILLSDGIAVVADFGVAKALSAAQPAGNTLTAAGVAIGTPAYMAPEQATGDPGTNHRADIYSFGIIAYEVLAGRPPFDDRSTHRLISAHLTRSPAPIAGARPDAPAPLADLIMRCLAKDPAARPQTAAELLTTLRVVPSEAAVAKGERHRAPLLIAAGIAVAAVIAFLATRGARRSEKPVVDPVATRLAPAVAVIPFENLARDSASEFISDGMTDEVLATLDRVPTLRVASRATTFAYKGTHEEPRSLAQTLGVDALLTGSVRRDGDVIMLSTQLVSGKTGLPLWSQTYQRPVQDLYEIQGDIARSIASALRVTLAPGVVSTSRPTKDPVAYELYLQGRHQLRETPTGDSAGAAKAADLFRRAITRDPDFALAHAYLARTYVRLADNIPPRVLLPLAKAAATRAIELDPTQTDAVLSLASIRFNFEWDWAGAENEYQRAIALDSTSVAAHVAYMWYLIAARRFDEAHLEAEVANRLEREQAVDSSYLVATARRSALPLAMLGRYGEADSLMRVAFNRDSGLYIRWQYGLQLVMSKHPSEAVRHLEVIRRMRGEQLPYLTHLGIAYAHAGVPDSARRILATLEKRSRREYVPKDQLSALQLALGDTTEALRYLALAVKERHFWLPALNGSALFDPLRSHPEFRRLMREVGAPDR